ncbi:cupredoxin domain-containing protein [Pseudonocardia sp. DSM 110487]|uniref:cupredoxin domain-containing protein n=1 Tax=Pseudonocardia sp. DSM 110487 TaxID=2865833 RepID=UPI002108063F|nr:cupredoxin domain-containing protein [Pseudonocardia sp. DSM 110487]
MDPIKSRKWIAAATLAAAAVFLVMVFGERGGAPPPETSSAEAVLTSEGSAADGSPPAGEATNTDAGVLDAMQQLIDALGIDPDDLASADAGGNNNSEDAGGDNNPEDTGGNNADDESTEPTSTGSITIDNFAFGQPITVVPGATVEVKNLDSATHNATATNSAFKTPNLATGESATFTAPDTPGRYEFTCTLHPEMTGTLIVEDSSGGDRRGGGKNSSDQNGSNQNGSNQNGSNQNGNGSRDRSGGGSDSSGTPTSSSKNGDAERSDRGAADAQGTSSGHGSGDGY